MTENYYLLRATAFAVMGMFGGGDAYAVASCFGGDGKIVVKKVVNRGDTITFDTGIRSRDGVTVKQVSRRFFHQGMFIGSETKHKRPLGGKSTVVVGVGSTTILKAVFIKDGQRCKASKEMVGPAMGSTPPGSPPSPPTPPPPPEPLSITTASYGNGVLTIRFATTATDNIIGVSPAVKLSQAGAVVLNDWDSFDEQGNHIEYLAPIANANRTATVAIPPGTVVDPEVISPSGANLGWFNNDGSGQEFTGITLTPAGNPTQWLLDP